MLSDIKFMMDISLGFYWKFCLGVFVPISLTAMCVYIVVTYEPLTYKVRDITGQYKLMKCSTMIPL